MLARAILPPLVIATGAALWAPDAAAIALLAGVAVAAIATLASIASRSEVSTDTARALRATLAGLLIRLAGGLGLVVLGAATLPTHAALIAVVTGIGLAGAVAMQAWATVAGREITSG
ncbi:MAG TPA: hypothetical protein VEL07_06340 [Planctomycetota bacterium]|nr:hypothetical protein [Planctomycetota bacterium]